MPYIAPEQRFKYNRDLPKSPGVLNYSITYLIVQYLKGRENYASYNEVIGVLECAKLELYRRMVAPYEDKKIEENGDVYPAASTPA